MLLFISSYRILLFDESSEPKVFSLLIREISKYEKVVETG